MRRRARPFVLSPSRWPVRWRLALVSSALTFAILLIFAGVVGRLAQERLESDFRSELEKAATELSLSIDINPLTGEPSIGREDLERMASNDSTVRVIDGNGEILGVANPRPLPEPQSGIVSHGDLEVVTRPLLFSASALTPVYVQYARDHDELDATVNRLWLFLGIGVAGGTILATLAGLAVAGRAMRPIAALTATAREIASTRDPSREMPEPRADDEVAELARTLDNMLRELDAARSEAQQMVHAQREFVADASHELRTPLTSILANLELLQEHFQAGGRDPAEAEEMVASALRSSRRMRRLVGDLLILARADAGRVGRRADCDLAEIADAAVAEVRPVAGSHSLSLAARGPALLRGNPDELHRLALNLIDNAVRHTPADSRIDVAVERRGDDVVLEVSDDGPGLPPGLEEQVFSRFVRGAGPADIAGDAGTGLGLAIVDAVAGSHGGSVTAGRSRLGGARFTVRLPGIPREAASEAREPAPTAS